MRFRPDIIAGIDPRQLGVLKDPRWSRFPRRGRARALCPGRACRTTEGLL